MRPLFPLPVLVIELVETTDIAGAPVFCSPWDFMHYRFSELVDIHAVRRLLTRFHKVANMGCALYEADGTKLATSKWEPVCIRFHRKNPGTRKRCVESDTVLFGSVLQGRKYVIYECENGMMDAAAPVMVAGEHVATVFSGQVFFEEPDWESFRRQARQFGFDEVSYLESLRNVPILSRHKLEPVLDYLSEFAQLLGELGLRQLQQLEAQETLRESELKYRSIFENAVEGIFQAGPDGHFLDVNPTLARMHGFESPAQMMGEVSSVGSRMFIDTKDRRRLLRLLGEKGLVKFFEVQTRKKDGSKMWVSMGVRAARDKNDGLFYEGIVENISDRKNAEIEMKETQRRLKTLSQSLLKKMEAERHYIAYELHDQIGQALTAVQMNLESMRALLRPQGLTGYLDEGIAVIDGAMEQVRSLSLNLRPAVLDDLGLASALRWLTNSVQNKREIRISFTSTGMHSRRLPREIETACFRVAQEALTNILRHAQAKNVTVNLERNRKGLDLIVKDDGVGFEARKIRAGSADGSSFGLLGMEERVTLLGGGFDIDSKPGQGTLVYAHFPPQA
jgi:PAS domain S-box-containing protein